MPNIGDIFTALIYYKGQSGPAKARPVLVVNDLGNDWYTIVEITSVPPKSPPGYYDGFKEPIKNWWECGLDQQSYVKCSPNNVHNVEGIRLHQHIGTMNTDDFDYITDKIIEYGE